MWFCIWQHPHPCAKVNNIMHFTSCLALLDICSNHAPLQHAVASGKIIIKKNQTYCMYFITKPDKSLSRYWVILCKLSLQYTKPKLSLKFSFVKILNRALHHRKMTSCISWSNKFTNDLMSKKLPKSHY